MTSDHGHIFPAKILVFGEYTVLQGGDALAIPYDHYFGSWKENNVEGLHKDYHSLFPRFLDHVIGEERLSKMIDHNLARKEYDQGIRYVSSIPDNMGLGSSGAFCAAFLRRYQRTEFDREDAIDLLKLLENFFHGTSSGIDPVVSYFQENIVKSKDGFQAIDFDRNRLMTCTHLVNSGVKRNTSEYVEMYKAKYEYIPRFEMMQQRLLELNNFAISFLKDDNWEKLETVIDAISRTQRSAMVSFIPHELRDEWEEGWDNRKYMKLCGAGGGGMFLRFDFSAIP